MDNNLIIFSVTITTIVFIAITHLHNWLIRMIFDDGDDLNDLGPGVIDTTESRPDR